MYAEYEGAKWACEELSGTVLNDKIIGIEPLGDNGNPRSKKEQKPSPAKGKGQSKGGTAKDELPKLLPVSLFKETDTADDRLKLCIAAFEDVVVNHDPETQIPAVRGLIHEVNEVVTEHEDVVKNFVTYLKKHKWMRDNSQNIRYRAPTKTISMSKISASSEYRYTTYGPDAWPEQDRQKKEKLEQRKREQQMSGKPIFEVPEEEKAKAEQPLYPWKPMEAKPGAYKVSMCRYHIAGFCARGENCTFAHTQDEIHPSSYADSGYVEAAYW
jgi:hypothetical protein